MKKERNINIELLRCLSMLLIVIGHYYGNVASNIIPELNSAAYFASYFINSIEVIGVNLFVIISAWFLVDSKFSIKKIILLIVQVFTYSVILYGVSVVITHSFSITDFIRCCIPIYERIYWFATEYIRFYLIVPFLNLFVKSLTKKQHQVLCVVLITMYALYPTFMDMQNLLKFIGNWSAWFITIYFVVTYIKWYAIEVFSLKRSILGWGLCSVLVFASKCVIDNITTIIIGHSVGSNFLSHNNSIFVLCGAVCCFMFFYKINLKISPNIR